MSCLAYTRIAHHRYASTAEKRSSSNSSGPAGQPTRRLHSRLKHCRAHNCLSASRTLCLVRSPHFYSPHSRQRCRRRTVSEEEVVGVCAVTCCPNAPLWVARCLILDLWARQRWWWGRLTTRPVRRRQVSSIRKACESVDPSTVTGPWRRRTNGPRVVLRSNGTHHEVIQHSYTKPHAFVAAVVKSNRWVMRNSSDIVAVLSLLFR